MRSPESKKDRLTELCGKLNPTPKEVSEFLALQFGYVVVFRAGIGLSLSARVVLGELINRGGSTVKVSVREMESTLGISKNTVSNAISELEAAGFLHRESESTSKGKFKLRIPDAMKQEYLPMQGSLFGTVPKEGQFEGVASKKKGSKTVPKEGQFEGVASKKNGSKTVPKLGQSLSQNWDKTVPKLGQTVPKLGHDPLNTSQTLKPKEMETPSLSAARGETPTVGPASPGVPVGGNSSLGSLEIREPERRPDIPMLQCVKKEEDQAVEDPGLPFGKRAQLGPKKEKNKTAWQERQLGQQKKRKEKSTRLDREADSVFKFFKVQSMKVGVRPRADLTAYERKDLKAMVKHIGSERARAIVASAVANWSEFSKLGDCDKDPNIHNIIAPWRYSKWETRLNEMEKKSETAKLLGETPRFQEEALLMSSDTLKTE